MEKISDQRILFLPLLGTDKTYQRADLGKHGVTFKVVPMYTEKDGNYIGCWKLEGHKGWPIIPQPIVPNMSYFKVRSQLIDGITSMRVALTCDTFYDQY